MKKEISDHNILQVRRIFKGVWLELVQNLSFLII